MKIHPAGAKSVFSAVASLFRVRTLPLAVLVLLTEQGAAYAQCAPVPPGPVSLAAGACTDTDVRRENAIGTAVRVTGGEYRGLRVTVEAGGGRIVNGLVEIPGGDFAMNCVDPQGAPFGLVGGRR